MKQEYRIIENIIKPRSLGPKVREDSVFADSLEDVLALKLIEGNYDLRSPYTTHGTFDPDTYRLRISNNNNVAVFVPTTRLSMILIVNWGYSDKYYPGTRGEELFNVWSVKMTRNGSTIYDTIHNTNAAELVRKYQYRQEATKGIDPELGFSELLNVLLKNSV